jgi:molybdopterin biosynthesis enzyme
MAQGYKTGGRKKGTPNKITTDIRAMISAALEKVGGEKYLVSVAKKDPKAFLTLVAKVIPTELSVDLGPVSVKVLRFTDAA